MIVLVTTSALAGAIDVTAAEYVACALDQRPDRTVAVCWGELSGLRGQQGSDGPQGPTDMGGPPGLVTLETDGYRLLGVDGAGVLWTWRAGQTPVELHRGVSQVVAGSSSLCVVTTGAQARCWSEGWENQVPLERPAWEARDVVQAVAGVQVWCVRTSAGEARCGRKPYASEEDPSGVVAKVEDAVGLFVGQTDGCLLSSSKAPVCFGTDEPPEWARRPMGLASYGWVDDRWGWCGVGADGHTRCSFDSEGVELAIDLPGPPPDELELGEEFACGRWGGEVRCWGEGAIVGLVADSEWRGPVRVPGLTEVAGLDVQRYRTCATTTSGAHQCWGPEGGGPPSPIEAIPAEDPCTLVDGVAVGTDQWACRGLDGVAGRLLAYGPSTVCIVTPEGAVRCGGDGDRGALGHGRMEEEGIGEVVGLVPPIRDLDGRDGTFCVVDAAGVACWGDFALAPYRVAVPDPVDVEVGGQGLTCVATASGEVWCRVSNPMPYLLEAHLGVGRLPTRLDGLSDVVELGLGVDHGCVRHRDGGASCFGRPAGFRLGDHGTAVSTPVVIDLRRAQ